MISNVLFTASDHETSHENIQKSAVTHMIYANIDL